MPARNTRRVRRRSTRRLRTRRPSMVTPRRERGRRSSMQFKNKSRERRHRTPSLTKKKDKIVTKHKLPKIFVINLRGDKDKWNKLCKQINLADCEIADRHCSQTTDKCLEWFAVLLRKYNFEVSETLEAKPQKAKELRSNAEKEHRADFIQWKLEGNKGKQLQSYLWYKLLSRELSLNGLPRNSKAFLDCYSYIKVSQQQLSHRNCIS